MNNVGVADALYGLRDILINVAPENQDDFLKMLRGLEEDTSEHRPFAWSNIAELVKIPPQHYNEVKLKLAPLDPGSRPGHASSALGEYTDESTPVSRGLGESEQSEDYEPTTRDPSRRVHKSRPGPRLKAGARRLYIG